MSQLFSLAHFSSACFYVSSRIRLILSLSLCVLCLAFLSRIYIAVASLLNGLIDILLDFYVLCPWNFSFFISLSFFLCRDLCTDIWLVGRLRRWLETKEIGPKVSFIILVFWYFIIVFVVWLFIVLSSVFYLFILHPASCICTFLSSARSTDYWGDMGEFNGTGRAGAVYRSGFMASG